MTKAKYTSEERKQVFRKHGVALAEYNKNNPRAMPEKERIERMERAVKNLCEINKNRHLYESDRLNGLRRSQKAKDSARRILIKYHDQMVEARARNPGFMKCPENFNAVEWRFMSPTKTIYSFRNLADFIRNNEHLFEREHVQWKPRKHIGTHGDTGESCLAYSGLSQLKPYNKKGEIRRRVGSWKGWIWWWGGLP